MKILLKIIVSITLLAVALFSLSVVSYFAMLAYFAYKDGTIYEYEKFKCKNKSFTNAIEVSISRSNYSKIIHLKMEKNKNVLKVYPTGSKFKFLSLYSIYDFEGGTFYDYLVEDEEGIKSFIDFGDIDPEECTFDIQDKYWFKNNKKYRPTNNKTKISKSTRDDLFDFPKDIK